MEKIAETIKIAIKNEFDIDVEPAVTIPESQHGDFSTNIAMQLAKQLGKNPMEIAEELVRKLESSQVGKFEIAKPGYINISVSAGWLNDNLNENWSDKYGENNDGDGRTVIVEYPSPNIAKPYSVGHLRTGNQGWAARNLMMATGWNVITDNHIGDYGAPFGIWVVGFERLSSEERLAKGGVYELGRIYILMKAELAKEEKRGEDELAKSVQNWLLRLENGDKEALAYHKSFNQISIDHMHNVMERLGISTDFEYPESFYVERGKAEVQKLLANGTAIQNPDSSVIVNLDKYGIKTPILLQKSNGAALYATTDCATLLFREERWHPDRVIYAVAVEQKFHFEQLFALAQEMGINTELIHMWFGLIDQIYEDGKRERMSSRKGVVLMEELLDKAEATAKQGAKSDEISDDDIRKIALGAIKFTDFSKDRRTNILFDWDSMFSLTGFSGPYVQYAAVRINKILKDYQTIEPPNHLTDYDYEPEKIIIKKLIEYPEIIKQSADNLEPHRVAQYVYDLARVMNRYYENTPIATKDVEESIKLARLDVLAKVSQVFEHGLKILGIEIPERM